MQSRSSRAVPVTEENPVVVGVLVVVAGDLLLLGACWVALDVGVQQAATVTVVFDGCFGAVDDLQGVRVEVDSLEAGLEEGAHIGVAGSGAVEDGKVEDKVEEVDADGKSNEADDTGDPVVDVCFL